MTPRNAVFLCFDVWGESTRNLVSIDIIDIPAGTQQFSGTRSVHSEN